MRTKLFFTSLLILVILRSVNPAIFDIPLNKVVNQNSLEQLEIKLKSQYRATEKLFAAPPDSRGLSPSTWHRLLREWQDDLAQSFAKAATTVTEIIALNPPSREMWQERLDTLRLYSQPVSSPDERTVYGSGEVQKSARILETPLAVYTDEARAAKIHGDVRLRLVLASDGTVKNVFPIKSLSHGLTESAMKAARQIKFEPALRNGEPASQFETFVYEFEKGHSRPPYIPRTVF
jgi:TonB family protein